MSRRAYGVVLTAVLLALAACTDEAGPRPAEGHSVTPVSSASTPSAAITAAVQQVNIEPAPTTVLSVKDAGPAAPHLVDGRTAPQASQGPKPAVIPEIDLNGSTWIAIWSAPLTKADMAAEPLVLPEEKIGLLTAGHFTAFATAGRDPSGNFAGKRRQITDMSLGSGYVVWVETPSSDLGGNEWTIRGYNLSTRNLSEIAHSPYLKRGHRLAGAPGSTVPVELGTYTYWATAVPLTLSAAMATDKDWSWQVQRHRLDGRGRTTTVATNAAFAATTGSALFYATGTEVSGGATRFVLHRRVGGAGPDQQVAHGSGTGTARLTNIAAGAGQLVWTVNSPDDSPMWVQGQTTPGQVYVMDLTSGKVTQIDTQDDAGPNYSIAFGPRKVLWGNGSGNGDPSQYLLDLVTGRLYRLGATRGLSIVIASPGSPRITWQKNCRTAKDPTRVCNVSAEWRS